MHVKIITQDEMRTGKTMDTLTKWAFFELKLKFPFVCVFRFESLICPFDCPHLSRFRSHAKTKPFETSALFYQTASSPKHFHWCLFHICICIEIYHYKVLLFQLNFAFNTSKLRHSVKSNKIETEATADNHQQQNWSWQ